ncbi:disulfide bond formation protein B, partial [Hansschlegelia beijingensis]
KFVLASPWSGIFQVIRYSFSPFISHLLKQMSGARLVPCDAAAWRLLGLSLAGYNALIAAGLAALAVYALRRPSTS